ncbi:HK97 family phage prohead protease [uncultured Sphingomonas sp.]|uniref:HK97 family phage prohead protease n=1 Tax=uncultured Sphingomonas sp. TaxID=158754 RepID=UPI0025DDBD2B|nr:HK97 family phage prohead protease [uncultured Sphingomonas sp.]
MNELDFPLDVKAIDVDGSIEGIAAGYGNVDHGGDVIIPGAATKSLTGRASMPMLLFHDQRRPVGVWREFTETADGLHVKGRFAMSTDAGRDAHAMTKDGALAGLSVGYQTLRDKLVGKARHLLEVALHEISLVTIPMNGKALITSVKGIEDAREKLAAGDRLTEREFEAFFKALNLSNAEAERAVRINLKGQGAPGDTAIDDESAFWRALAG